MNSDFSSDKAKQLVTEKIFSIQNISVGHYWLNTNLGEFYVYTPRQIVYYKNRNIGLPSALISDKISFKTIESRFRNIQTKNDCPEI